MTNQCLINTMRRRNSTSIIVVMLLGLVVYGCGDTILQSEWTTSPIVVDGKLIEWSTSAFKSFDEPKARLCARNDESFLYLAVKVSDKRLMRMLAVRGITVHVDVSGNKTHALELNVPAYVFGGLDIQRGGLWASFTDEQQRRAQRKVEELCRGVLVIDRSTQQSRGFPVGNEDGFAGAISLSGDQVTIEIRVPRVLGKYLSSTEGMGSKCVLGFTWVRDMNTTMMPGSPFPGMPGDTAPTRRGPPGKGDPREKLPEELWVEVNLATK